ncbi:MAG: NAD(P)-dependent alcohol dehydrogenase [Steroidobacteraceae bacterium]
MKTSAYAAQSAKLPLRPYEIERREPGPRDVAIEILYCGVCHSDLHTVRSEWDGVLYPCVPGHEIVGRVSRVGSRVSRVAPGALVAVGCMVDSCRVCEACKAGLEQYCDGPHGFTQTYNGWVKGGGENTYGGYSSSIVVDEHFVLEVKHDAGQLAAVAPLLCAGITTWSPLRHWQAGPGKTVGIVGIGGLGHMGVKLARALEAHVVAFTTSAAKAQEARRLGADEVVVSTEASELARREGTLDFILDTVAASHDLDTYIKLLKRDGALTLVGAPATPHPSPAVFNLLLRRRSIAGSAIGGIAETQEMLDFCAARNIVSDIEMIAMADIEKAYARLLRGDVRYRFVIDMQTVGH